MAAEIESSKIFAKEFMKRQGIPTARWASFKDYDAATHYINKYDFSLCLCMKWSNIDSRMGQCLEYCLSGLKIGPAPNWPRPIVRDEQQSGKDEFSFTELVLPDECPCLTL